MRKLLNTLYVTTPEAYLSKDGQNIVMSVRGVETFRVPAVNIEQIITFGYMGASPGLMQLCVEQGIQLTFLTPNGRFVARVEGATHGNVLLRRAQYLMSDDFKLHTARLIIAAKIHNSRAVMLRRMRDHGPDAMAEQAANQLLVLKRQALKAADPEELLGEEGAAGNAYFGAFPSLITIDDPAFGWSGRNRRPPRDRINAMLSFAYTLMTNDITAALEAVGLDPYVGVMHTLRPGRVSLALDMVEEFRAPICDRFVLSLVNRRQISPADFIIQGDEGVLLTDNGRRTFLSAWQQRKRETITHPYLGCQIELGLLPHAQAMLMARYIRGQIDDYPVFLVK